ncbi:Mediator of RNA polymerase II transcription subunit 27-B [Fasciola hepatica]|uniref:Mediator of RNA polymerase II transcription subunit 27-B n=1 Tax=Fasciola hepatica TaxID=6192 RepID=A0A4E0RUZ1_FASHE|nr:Mediator of RNA polymerase II transcription subunit 27-B [Fasciola hepatica]
MNTNTLVNTHISKLAQDSLREVKRLRIILTRLLSNVTNASEQDSDGADELPDVEARDPGMTDNRMMMEPPASPRDQSTMVKKDVLHENLQPHRLILQIKDCFEALDEMARCMRSSRARSCMGDLGLHNALSLITTVDQLEFPSSPTEILDETDSFRMRRVDWLVDRWDAERWKNRYCERAHTILEGLLSCSMFQRSHLNSEQKRRKRDSMLNSSRDVRFDLECLLNEIHASSPKLIITLIDSGLSVSVVHVKVGEVMQCLVTFRRLHPAWITVRGLTESCLIHQTNKATSVPMEKLEELSETDSLSKPLEELLTSKSPQNAAVKETLTTLLTPGPKLMRSDQETRSRRAGNSPYAPRPIQTNNLHLNQLDLVTPSRYTLFQRITALAQCMLLHWSNDYQPASAVRSFFTWLQSYHDLYTAPCVRCNQLLGQDLSLPLWRSYSQSRRSVDQRTIEAHHEYCQAIS